MKPHELPNFIDIENQLQKLLELYSGWERMYISTLEDSLPQSFFDSTNPDLDFNACLQEFELEEEEVEITLEPGELPPRASLYQFLKAKKIGIRAKDYEFYTLP